MKLARVKFSKTGGNKLLKKATFRIIANPNKDWAVDLSREVAAFIAGKGLEVVEGNENICIIIGGDGTIFHEKQNAHGWIFGIGGPQSKVCQANRGDWKELIAKVIEDPKTQHRTALSVMVNGRNVGWAINDAVVHTRRHDFITINVEVNGNAHEFGGDGVVVCTPTGATGYAWSAGGFVIGRESHLVEVVGICPYMRAFRPMLAPVANLIKIRHRGDADLIIDGQDVIELGEGDIVGVIADRKVVFVDV